MKLDKNKAILGLLTLVVVASGCTQNDSGSVSTTQTQAVEIQEFSAFPSEVSEGNSVQLRAVVKNTGGADATNVEMEIFNIPITESNANDGEWEITNGDKILDFTTGSPLTAPDPESNIPSSPRERVLNLNAPSGLDSSTTIPYDIRGQLRFGYETTAVTQIELMGEQRYRETGATRTKPSVDNSGGPIQIDVRTRTPIVFYGQQNDQNTASQLCLIVRNEGTGTPYLPGSSTTNSNADKIEVTVSSPDITLSPSGTQEVSIVGNRGVKCYQVDNVGDDPSIQTTSPVTVTADYKYAKETSTSVTVNGRR